MTDQPVKSSQIQARKVQWLWRERIAKGTITVVAGKPDQGKGLFSAHLAADVSRRGGKVLYSAIEDAPELMTRPRLEAAGAKLDNVYLTRFMLPTQQRELESWIIDLEIDLVVIDPFAAHLHGVRRQSDDIRQVLNPLSALIEQTGTSVLIIEHALKKVPTNSHPLNAIGGSGSGLVAAARMGYLLGVDPDDQDKRILGCVKSNLRLKPKALSFEVDTEEVKTAGEMPMLGSIKEIEFDIQRLVKHSTPGKVGRKPDKRAAAAEWVVEYLADKGKATKVGDVIEDARQHGLSVKTLKRAVEDLEEGIVKHPPGGGRNCTWDLSDELKKILGVKIVKPKAAGKPRKSKAKKAAEPAPAPATKPVKASDIDVDAEFADLLGGGESK